MQVQVHVLMEIPLGRWMIGLCHFPFDSHASLVADAERHIDEGLWSSDPSAIQMSMWSRLHPRAGRVFVHVLALLHFVLAMAAALVPVPRWHTLAVRCQGDAQHGPHVAVRARFYGIRWLRLGLSLCYGYARL